MVIIRYLLRISLLVSHLAAIFDLFSFLDRSNGGANTSFRYSLVLQAKPSQAKVLSAAGDLRSAQVDFPCLLAFPGLDRIAGLSN